VYNPTGEGSFTPYCVDHATREISRLQNQFESAIEKYKEDLAALKLIKIENS
jgi:hypothetical protein